MIDTPADPSRRYRGSVLSSYAFFTTKIVAELAQFHAEGVEVIIDSGAFSAYISKKPIRLSEYAAALAALPFTPHMAMALDVIGDANATWRNFLEHRERRDPVAFVYTRGAPIAHAKAALDAGEYIAVGGLKTAGTLKPYLAWLATQVPMQRVHLLGVARGWVIGLYRPHSCDSATWKAGQMYGLVKIYAGNGRMRDMTRNQVLSPAKALVVGVGLANVGFTLEDVRRSDAFVGSDSVAQQIATRAFVLMQRDAERVGTRFALVVSSCDCAQMLRNAMTWCRTLTDSNT